MPNHPESLSPSQSGNCALTVAPDLTLLLSWTPSGVSNLTLGNAQAVSHQNPAQIPPFVTETLRLLRSYFCGTPVSFLQIPLDLPAATEFQRATWTACKRIPWGATRSYKWLAREVGQPAAAQAVGNALHMNPLPIIIPCHRVIRSDGSLGGFRYGTDLKRRLLAIENQ